MMKQINLLDFTSTSENINKIKLSILGNGHVGKTSLCRSFGTGRVPGHYELTIGVEISAVHNVSFSKLTRQPVTLVLWDLAGQERFESVRPLFYRGTRVAILVFDVCNRGSFYDVPSWIREVQSHGNVPMVIVGNKIDAPGREVAPEEACELAKRYGAEYIETSALEGANVEHVFEAATRLAFRGSIVSF